MSFFLKFSKHFPEETVLAQWRACVTAILEIKYPSLGSPRSPYLLKKTYFPVGCLHNPYFSKLSFKLTWAVLLEKNTAVINVQLKNIEH